MERGLNEEVKKRCCLQMWDSVSQRCRRRRGEDSLDGGRKRRRTSKKRLILVGSLLALNLILLVMGAVFQPEGVPSYILMVFIANLLLYVAYYLAMKVSIDVDGNIRTTPLNTDSIPRETDEVGVLLRPLGRLQLGRRPLLLQRPRHQYHLGTRRVQKLE